MDDFLTGRGLQPLVFLLGLSGLDPGLLPPSLVVRPRRLLGLVILLKPWVPGRSAGPLALEEPLGSVGPPEPAEPLSLLTRARPPGRPPPIPPFGSSVLPGGVHTLTSGRMVQRFPEGMATGTYRIHCPLCFYHCH